MKSLYQSGTKGKIVMAAILLVVVLTSISIWQIGTKQITKNNQNLSELGEGSSLHSEVYTIDNGCISKILPETTLRDLKNNLDEEEVVGYKQDNTELQDTEYVGSGMKLVHNREEYKLAVVGDLNGDGKLRITDLVQMRLTIVGLRDKLVGEYEKAGDLNYDGKVSITDLTKINLAVVNLVDIIAPNTFVPEVVTTKDTITVLGETTDAGSGIKEYYFELNNNGWVQNTDKTNNKYTYTGLEMETKYNIRMKVVDNAGNTKITKRVEVETLNEENANIGIVASTEEWTNQNILVAINFNSNVAKEKKEISLDNGTTWIPYTEPITVEKNMKIKARVVNAKGETLEEREKTITNIDKTLPEEFEIGVRTTENSIIVEAETEDGAATTNYGKSGIKEYEYTIVNGIWQSVTRTEDTTHTFTDITPGVEYTITVKAIDNAGNERIAKNSDGTEDGEKVKITPIDDLIEESGGEMIITPSTLDWTNEDITVTVEYPEITGLTGEISLDNGITWKDYEGEETVQTNTVVKARMKNSQEHTSTPVKKEIANIDKLAPKNFEINAIAKTNSITVNASAEDETATDKYGKSEIAGYKFKINDGNWTEVQQSGTYTFEGLMQGTNYEIKVKAVDNAGNETNGNQNGSVDGITVPTPTIDDILKDLEENGEIGTIQIKQNTEAFTNEDVVIEIVYPYVDGLKREVKVGEEDWREYTETFKIEKNAVIQARLTDSSNQSGAVVSKDIINIDKLAPNNFEVSGTPTTNTITVSVGTAEDPGATDTTGTEEYACSGIKEYKYTIINGLWQWSETSTEPTHTFRNLMQGKSYSIKVTAIDNAGNEKLSQNGDSSETSITTNTTGEITITADKTELTKEDVIVTVTYPSDTEELRREISTDGGANWQDYTNALTQVTITENTIVKARLMDGENQVGRTAEYRVVNIDKLPPENFTINETVTSTTIEISGTTTDSLSGIDGYYFSKDNGANWVQNTNKLVNKYKFERLTPATTYSMQIKVVDKVGNERIVTKEVTTDAKYTLTVDVNGGTYTGQTTIQKAEGETTTIQNPTRTGYNFNGWTLEGEGTLNGTTYTFGTGNAKLTAEWEAIEYTLTIDANGGTYTGQTTITGHYGDSINVPNATRIHTVTYNLNGGGSVSPTSATVTHEFRGWYTSPTYGSGSRVYLTTMPQYSQTVYAQWIKKSVILPTPTRSGYTFGGWYTDSACTASAGNGGSSYYPESNITLYAKWTKIQYAVDLETNGGTVSNTKIIVDAGQTITLPTPTKSTYIFKGWYSDVNLTNKVADGGQSYTVNSYTKLYAKWIGEPIYVLNGSNPCSSVTGGWSGSGTITYGSNYMVPNGTIWVNTPIQGNRKYIKIQYSVDSGETVSLAVGYGTQVGEGGDQNWGITLSGGTPTNPNTWTGTAVSTYGGNLRIKFGNGGAIKVYSIILCDER